VKGGKHRPAPPDEPVTLTDLVQMVRLRQQALAVKEK